MKRKSRPGNSTVQNSVGKDLDTKISDEDLNSGDDRNMQSVSKHNALAEKRREYMELAKELKISKPAHKSQVSGHR